MFASVHLHPAWTISIAAAVGAWVGWYWMRLGRTGVPASRRRIRRASLVGMTVGLVILVLALSFIDPAVHKRQYVIAWMGGLLCVFIVMAIAGLDAMNNLRLLQRQAHDAATSSARELVEAIEQRRQAHRTSNEADLDGEA